MFQEPCFAWKENLPKSSSNKLSENVSHCPITHRHKDPITSHNASKGITWLNATYFLTFSLSLPGSPTQSKICPLLIPFKLKIKFPFNPSLTNNNRITSMAQSMISQVPNLPRIILPKRSSSPPSQNGQHLHHHTVFNCQTALQDGNKDTIAILFLPRMATNLDQLGTGHIFPFCWVLWLFFSKKKARVWRSILDFGTSKIRMRILRAASNVTVSSLRLMQHGRGKMIFVRDLLQ